MTREEFLRLYPLPSDNNLEVKMNNCLVEKVYIKTIYNQLVNLSSPSLMSVSSEYVMKMADIWQNTVESDLKLIEDKRQQIAEEALEKSKVAKELVRRGYNVEKDIQIKEIISDEAGTMYYKIYGSFWVNNIETLYLCWKGENVKRIVFIFVPDGVLKITYPPYNIRDDSPLGFVGVQPFAQVLAISG